MSNRGSGKTKQQMMTAPRFAIFVWCNNSSLYYAKRLAKWIQRTDIDIVSPGWLEHPTSWRGRNDITGVVLDHALTMTAAQQIGYDELKARMAK